MLYFSRFILEGEGGHFPVITLLLDLGKMFYLRLPAKPYDLGGGFGRGVDWSSVNTLADIIGRALLFWAL